jgi:hypothetical protein
VRKAREAEGKGKLMKTTLITVLDTSKHFMSFSVPKVCFSHHMSAARVPAKGGPRVTLFHDCSMMFKFSSSKLR